MTHEDFSRRLPPPRISNRLFGLVLGSMLAIIAFLPRLRGNSPRWWVGAIAAILLGTALAAPRILGPLQSVWMRFAHTMNIIVSHVISAFLLYLIFTPVGLVFRLQRKDSLRRRWEPHADSYWIHRDPPGPSPDTMINQF